MQQNRSDFFWFLATRLSALALAVASVTILVTDMEHENISDAQAMAVHKADMASHLRKSPAAQR